MYQPHYTINACRAVFLCCNIMFKMAANETGAKASQANANLWFYKFFYENGESLIQAKIKINIQGFLWWQHLLILLLYLGSIHTSRRLGGGYWLLLAKHAMPTGFDILSHLKWGSSTFIYIYVYIFRYIHTDLSCEKKTCQGFIHSLGAALLAPAVGKSIGAIFLIL